MDVVMHARAIGGGPVAAEHLQLISASNRHLTHKGKEVVGDAQRVFPNAAGRMSANWVEIAQASDPPGVRGTGVEIIQHLLHCGLGIALEGGSGAEHKGVAVMAQHGL